MTAFRHAPVLAREVAALLGPPYPAVFVDGTVGGGGHAEALLDLGAGSVRYLGVDRDPEAVRAATARLARHGDRVRIVHGRLSELRRLLDADHRIGPSGLAGGLLADLGLSSHQLDCPDRGFGFRAGGPLDMRMDQTQPTGAGELLDAVSAAELARILREFGEVPGARRLAEAIVDARRAGALDTAAELADLVAARAHPALRRRRVHPATRVFQALRCAVNDELGELDRFLDALPELLAPGGRCAVISFQSLEDRRIKRRFRELSGRVDTTPRGIPVRGREAAFVELTRRPVAPREDEIEANPRARSARLRVIERRKAT